MSFRDCFALTSRHLARILLTLLLACGLSSAWAQFDEQSVVRRVPISSNGGILSLTDAGVAWFQTADPQQAPVRAYGGSQKVLAIAAVGGGAVALFSGGAVYFSPNGTDLGGSGMSVRVYYGTERIAALAAAGGGVVTLFRNGRATFSPDGRNLEGGGSTVPAYTGSQAIVGLVEVPSGVKAEFSGGGIYFSATGRDLGGSGATVRTPVWNRMATTSAFGARDSAAGILYQRRFLLSSGFLMSPAWSYSDVWLARPNEFQTWELSAGQPAALTTPPTNHFEPYSPLVQADDGVLAVGSTVWKSTDGRSWIPLAGNGPTRATEDVSAHRLGSRYVAVNTYLAASYISDDGRNWSAALPMPGFAKRCGAANFRSGNRVWVAGGATCDYRTFLNDIWYTDDGVHWEQALSGNGQTPAAVPWAPRMWPASCTTPDGTMWIIGGYWRPGGANLNLADVWYSRDGVDWAQLPVKNALPGIGFTPRHAATCIPDAEYNRLVVVAGKGGNAAFGAGGSVLNDVWALELPKLSTLHTPAARWPTYTPDTTWATLAADSAAQYAAAGYTYTRNLQDYRVTGDYLNLGLTDQWRETERVRFDAVGVPQVKYGDTFYYNPVTTAEFALSMHGRYLRGLEPDLTKFWAGIARLEQLQGADGALRYVFPFSYYLTGQSFQPGWVSGMAQGMALSAYARAYLLSGNTRYLTAGQAALKFMLKPVSAGGATNDMRHLHPSLAGKIIYDEYPWLPSGYTLNGFMFAMMGVYDWMQMPLTDRTAHDSFFQAMDTLRHLLPYNEIGGFSAYDIGHITYAPRLPHIGLSYHSVHIYLLHALAGITGDPTLAAWEQRFVDQVAR